MLPNASRIDYVVGDGRAYEVKRAFADIAGGATVELVAAVEGKRTMLLSAALSAVTAVAPLVFKSGTTAITAAVVAPITGTGVLPTTPGGWCQTAAGQALNVSNGAGSGPAYVNLSYIERE